VRAPLFLAGLALVALLAAFFRVHDLDRLPPGLFGDEAADGLVAADILAGRARPVYVEEPAATKWGSREPLYHYLVAGVFAVLGPSAWSLRLTSALIGAATVLAFALLARRLFGPRLALSAALLLAVGRWHVGASRLGLRAIVFPLLLVLVVYAFTNLLERRTRRAAAAFGALLGLGFYTYPAYWAVPLALLVVLAAALAQAGPAARARLVPLAALGGACAALVMAPLIHYAASRPDYFFARVARAAGGGGAAAAAAPFLLDNAQKVLFMLHLRGDANPRHNLPGAPQLDPISGALFLIGLAVVVRGGRLDPPRRAGLLALWLLPLLPSALSDAAPHALRALGAAPAACVIAALGLERLAQAAAHRVAPAGAALTVVTLAAVSALNYRAYFHDWAERPELAAAFNGDALRFFGLTVDLADADDVYASPTVDEAPQRRFLALRRDGAWHRLDGADALVGASASRDRVFISDTPALQALIEDLYPRADVIARYALPDGRRGTVYRVPRAELRAALDDEQRAVVEALVRAERGE
jgi:4-amino-4-deoxy-L-arabinose transferase-like glycosyltransferase